MCSIHQWSSSLSSWRGGAGWSCLHCSHLWEHCWVFCGCRQRHHTLLWVAWLSVCAQVCTHQEHRLTLPPPCTLGTWDCSSLVFLGLGQEGSTWGSCSPLDSAASVLCVYLCVCACVCMYLCVCKYFFTFAFIFTFNFIYSLLLNPECSFES